MKDKQALIADGGPLAYKSLFRVFNCSGESSYFNATDLSIKDLEFKSASGTQLAKGSLFEIVNSEVTLKNLTVASIKAESGHPVLEITDDQSEGSQASSVTVKNSTFLGCQSLKDTAVLYYSGGKDLGEQTKSLSILSSSFSSNMAGNSSVLQFHSNNTILVIDSVEADNNIAIESNSVGLFTGQIQSLDSGLGLGLSNSIKITNTKLFTNQALSGSSTMTFID